MLNGEIMEPIYTIALFLHITAVFVLVGGIAVVGLAEEKLKSAVALDDLRHWAMVAKRTGAILGLSALVILIAGMYMAHARWGEGSPWVVAALLGLVLFAASGPLVMRKGIMGAVQAASAVGSITSEVRRQLHAPAMLWVSSLRGPFLLWFAYLMTAKPGIEGVMVTLAIAFALGAAVVAMRKRATGG